MLAAGLVLIAFALAAGVDAVLAFTGYLDTNTLNKVASVGLFVFSGFLGVLFLYAWNKGRRYGRTS